MVELPGRRRPGGGTGQGPSGDEPVGLDNGRLCWGDLPRECPAAATGGGVMRQELFARLQRLTGVLRSLVARVSTETLALFCFDIIVLYGAAENPREIRADLAVQARFSPPGADARDAGA